MSVPVITSLTAKPSGVDSAHNTSLLNWTATGLPVFNYGSVPFFGLVGSAPTGLTATATGTGGNWFGFLSPPGTYYYKVTSINASGVETHASSQVSAVVGATSIVTLAWTAVTGTSVYRVYRGASSGGQDRHFDVTTNAFIDVGAQFILDDGAGTVLDVTGNSASFPTITATTTFTLTALDGDGSDTATVTVTLSDVAIPTITLSADTTSITAGQNVLLSWDWEFADTLTINNGVGDVWSQFTFSTTVQPHSTLTYIITATNPNGSATASVTITVSGGGGGGGGTSAFESDHPYQGITYSFQYPSWPGGTNTIYLTFSADSFVDPPGWAGSPSDNFTFSTDLDSHSFQDISLSGYTLALQSTDGVIGVNCVNGGGQEEFYGFKCTYSLTAPASNGYQLGNPFPTDYPPDARNNDPGPSIVYGNVVRTPPLHLLPGQVGHAYGIQNQADPTSDPTFLVGYQMRFPNAPGATFAISSGTLPPGLTMDSSGLIAGTPTGGDGTFTVTGTGSGISATQSFTIPVFVAPIAVGGPGYTSEEWALQDLHYAFHRNGARYCILMHRPNSSSNIRDLCVFKSLDDGATWTELDPTHHPKAPEITPDQNIAIDQLTGDGTHVTLTYWTASNIPLVVQVGDWLNIQGASSPTTNAGFVGFFEIASLPVDTGTYWVDGVGDHINLFTITIENTTVASQTYDPTSLGGTPTGQTVPIVANYPVLHYPPTYTPNEITQSGNIGSFGGLVPTNGIFYDGGGNTIYAVTTVEGETGTSSEFVGHPGYGTRPTLQMTYFLRTFDLSTGLWGPVLTTGYNAFASYGGWDSRNKACALVVLTTGVWRLFFTGNPTDDTFIYSADTGLWFVDWDPTNLWHNTTQVYSTPPGPTTTGVLIREVWSCKFQTNSFVDNSVVNVTHLWFEATDDVTITEFVYKRIDSTGAVTSTYSVIDPDVGYPSAGPVPIPSIYEVGGTVFLPSRNELVTGVLAHNPAIPGAFDGFPRVTPGVLRGTPAETPTWTLELVAPWNANRGTYDTTIWTQLQGYPYISLTSDGKAALFMDNSAFLEAGENASAICVSVNTPALDGSTAHGWSYFEELYSLVWAPYDAFQGSSASFGVSPVFSAESASDNGWYLHFDGLPSTDGTLSTESEANFCFKTAAGAVVAVHIPFRIIVDLYGTTQLTSIEPSGTPLAVIT